MRISACSCACLLASVAVLRGQEKQAAGSAGATAGLRETPGWQEIPNTKLSAVCPEDSALQGNSGCRAVLSAWNGGVADTKNNRLLFFGGGHFDYYGNEVYALDLNQLSLRRLTEPGPIGNLATCPESYTDDTPGARHTYNGLAYLATQGAMYLYGGAKSPCGAMSDATWIFDLSTLKWTRRDPHKGDSPAGAPGAAADYDPKTGLVFLTDTRALFSYDYTKNLYTQLRGYSGIDYHLTGIVDPERRLFVLVGGPGQLWAIDIRPGSKYELRDLAKRQNGCDPILHAAYPGLAYDTEQKAIVGWAGGDTVYVLHPDTAICDVVTYPGGPGAAQQNGTEGRFRYFPALGVFALVNNWQQNAFALRLTPRKAGGSP